MASAIAVGLLASRAAVPSDLACLSDSGRSAGALAARTGIRHEPNLEALLGNADVLVVGFKPQHLAGADPRLAGLTSGRLVISILAGKRLARLAQVFPGARNLVRIMPNTPAQIGAGMSGWCAAHPLSPTDQAVVFALLDALGQHVETPEGQMDALTAVSGSGPAYVFEFVAALRDAGIAAGLAPDIAARASVQTLLGAACLLADRETDPETLRNQVTSPKGTTSAALQRLSERDFRGIVREAVFAAKTRSEELAMDN
jgi:pyrroline-5-carboxylate reductase